MYVHGVYACACAHVCMCASCLISKMCAIYIVHMYIMSVCTYRGLHNVCNMQSKKAKALWR